MTRIAVVVPVYRNGTTLAALAARLDAALADPWVLRLVVDACPDGSGAMAEQLAAADDRVRVTQLARNVGQHAALVQGLIAETDADAWVCMDGDLQDPPEAVPVLLARLGRGGAAGVFAGRRGVYESRGRMLTGGLYRRANRALTGLPCDAGAFLAMDRRLRHAIVRAFAERHAPSVVVAAAASRLPLVSVPVERELRADGTSSWSSAARLRQAARNLGWAARQSLTRSPLRPL